MTLRNARCNDKDNSYPNIVLLLEQLKYYHPSTTRSPKRFLLERRQIWISVNRHLNGLYHTCLACVNWSDRKTQRNENVTESATDKTRFRKQLVLKGCVPYEVFPYIALSFCDVLWLLGYNQRFCRAKFNSCFAILSFGNRLIHTAITISCQYIMWERKLNPYSWNCHYKQPNSLFQLDLFKKKKNLGEGKCFSGYMGHTHEYKQTHSLT